jgi:hypothetical protein
MTSKKSKTWLFSVRFPSTLTASRLGVFRDPFHPSTLNSWKP